MNRAIRWLRNILLGLVVLVIAAVTTAYALSERVLRRTYTEAATNIAVPTDAPSVAEGMRLSKIRGCAGCHGAQLAGQKFIDHLLIARVASPDLTIAAREYSNADLVRIIRRGVRPDGRSVVVMPPGCSPLFETMTSAKSSPTFEACRRPKASGAASGYASAPA